MYNLKQEADTNYVLTYERDYLITKLSELASATAANSNDPSSPEVSRDVMVSEVPSDMQLTIMETINSMSHETLMEFYNENVTTPGSPEPVLPEGATAASAGLKKPTNDRVRKTKPMTAMALIMHT